MLGDRSAEVARLQDGVANDPDVEERIRIYQEIYEASGITDEKLFDTLATRLAQGMSQGGAVKQMFWSGAQ